MDLEKKKCIFSLLKNANDYLCGYSANDIPCQMPNFKCDEDSENICEKIEKSPMELIAKKIVSCSRCVLYKRRKNCVPGEGVVNPIVLVIGEAPGADEDASSRPFVGKAGQLLDKMLLSINLDRKKNCFIANIVKCRPPENRDPEPEEIDACRSFLDAQIAILKPKMILSMGRIASRSLLKSNLGIGRLRNTFYEIQSIPLLCTYHPSALLRNIDLKRPAWEDLKLFKAKLEEICPDYPNFSGKFWSNNLKE